MKLRPGLVLILFLVIAAGPANSQDSPTPGVENVAPGVRVIHPEEVPSVGIDSASFEAAMKGKPSFSAARALLNGDGIPSVGPAGTTVHIYKAHDTVTAKNLVVILFVRDDTVVDYLIQDVAPRKARANAAPGSP